jgi:hypothetical protein
MSDKELSPVEQLRQQLADSKEEEPAKKPESKPVATKAAAKKRKVNVKSTSAKKVAKPAAKKVVKLAAKPAAKKPVRVAKKQGTKAAKKPAKKAAAVKTTKTTKKAPVKAAPSVGTRDMVRDRKGDGLTPIERKIIKFIEGQDEPVSVVTIGRHMFGKDCESESENSFRTVRNGLRFPVKYGMVDMVKGQRGLYKIGADYKRSKGNLNKLADRYRARIAVEKKAS